MQRHRRASRILLALTALVLAGASPGPAADTETEAAVDRLQAAYATLETLEARFVQTLESASIGRPQQESGTVYLRRPARMRWEYREPERKLAVVDGEQSWLYIPAENQVFVGSLAETRRGAVGLLLQGSVDLRRDFDVSPGPEDLRQPDADPLSLSPKLAGEEFTRIDLLVSRDSGLPLRIVVHGVLGDRMDYRFSDLRPGAKLRDALFRFEPPDGVEVVHSD